MNTQIELFDNLLPKREGMDKLIEYLHTTDFYTTIASTNFFNKDGGLLDYSLRLYNTAVIISDALDMNIKQESLAIVCLLANIARANMFECYTKNIKVYNDNGKREDAIGKFDWEETLEYKIKQPEDRLTGGTIGYNSFKIMRKFIKITDLEMDAICNINMIAKDNPILDMPQIIKNNCYLKLLYLAQVVLMYE